VSENLLSPPLALSQSLFLLSPSLPQSCLSPMKWVSGWETGREKRKGTRKRKAKGGGDGEEKSATPFPLLSVNGDLRGICKTLPA